MSQHGSGPTTTSQPAPYERAPYERAPYEPAPYGPALYGPAPHGPAPRRGIGATLTAVVVAMVLTVVAGAVLTIRLTGGDASAERVVGDGYSYDAPAGWTEFADPLDTMDTVVSPVGSMVDRVVIAVGIQPARGRLKTPGQLWEASSATYLRETDKLPTIHSGPSLDGQPTIEGRIELDESSYGGMTNTFYITEHDGRLYTVLVIARPDRAAEAEAALDDLVASWAWR